MNRKTLHTETVTDELKDSYFFHPEKAVRGDTKASSASTAVADNEKRDNRSNKRTVYRAETRSGTRSNGPRSETRTVNRSGEPEHRQQRASMPGSVFQELQESKPVRRTRRFSFEIFDDQVERIERLQQEYKKKKGVRLSSSRLIREALDEYLEKMPL